MNDDHRTALTRLLKRARPRLASTHALAFKSVFGAVAGYVNGSIFVSCGRFGTALRLPPEMLEQLFREEGAEPLRYFPNGHVKKQYAVLPERILEDRRRFGELIDESVGHVGHAGDAALESGPRRRLNNLKRGRDAVVALGPPAALDVCDGICVKIAWA